MIVVNLASRSGTLWAAVAAIVTLAGAGWAEEVARVVATPAAPAPGDDAAKADLDRLQGSWSCTHIEIGGKLVPPETYASNKNGLAAPIIRGDAWMEARREDDLKPYYTIKLNSSADPKQVELVHADGEVLDGIYKVEGDTLTFCFVVADDVPIRFATKKGLPLMLVSYKRKK